MSDRRPIRFRAAAPLAVVLMFILRGPAQAQEAATEVLDPDVGPELVAFFEADYPAAALREGREGSVLARAAGHRHRSRGLGGRGRAPRPISTPRPLPPPRASCSRPPRSPASRCPCGCTFEYVFSIREQARAVEEYVNLRGRLREMGTRAPLAGAMVVAAFPGADRAADLDVPWDAYLERIGGFAGQYREEDQLVTFTDDDGRFVFKSLPPGAGCLLLPNAGYEALRDSVADRGRRAGARPVLGAAQPLQRLRGGGLRRGEEKEVSRQSLSVTEVERLAGLRRRRHQERRRPCPASPGPP